MVVPTPAEIASLKSGSKTLGPQKPAGTSGSGAKGRPKPAHKWWGSGRWHFSAQPISEGGDADDSVPTPNEIKILTVPKPNLQAKKSETKSSENRRSSQRSTVSSRAKAVNPSNKTSDATMSRSSAQNLNPSPKKKPAPKWWRSGQWHYSAQPSEGGDVSISVPTPAEIKTLRGKRK